MWRKTVVQKKDIFTFIIKKKKKAVKVTEKMSTKILRKVNVSEKGEIREHYRVVEKL